MYSHQDWTPVVVKKKVAPVKEAVARTAAMAVATGIGGTGKVGSQCNHATHNAHNSDIPAWKIEKMVDGDSGPAVLRVSKEDAQAIIKGRVAMKLTQAQLARNLCIPEIDIKNIEAGKAVQNKALLARIKKALKLQ
jgi:putative transcription factor